MDAKEVKKADRFIQLGIKAANEAMQDANFIEDFDKDRFGISSASGIGGLPNIERTLSYVIQEGLEEYLLFLSLHLCNMLGGFISIEHKLKGPNLSSVTACAAGTHAIIEATKTIMLGCADKCW